MRMTQKARILGKDIIICRCMEVTEQESRDAIRSGCRTSNAVKKVTMAGMGLCQGRTCEQSINRLIAEELGVAISDLPPRSIRLPLQPIKMELMENMEL